MRGWVPLAGLPPIARWLVLGLAGLLIGLAIGGGVWTLIQHKDARAREAFAQTTASYRQALGNPDPGALEEAAGTLTRFIADYSRAPMLAQAWYYLGNVEYQRRRHEAAAAAYEEAARRDGGTIGLLSRLGQGYAWEAKGDPGRALDAYNAGLKGRGPKDFLYADLLLSVGRVQEQLKQPAAAIETYRRLLREAPDTVRGEEIRTRLAILGASA